VIGIEREQAAQQRGRFVQQPLLLDGAGEVIERVGIVGTKPQRFPVEGNRLIQITQIVPGSAQVIDDLRIPRLKSQSALVDFYCLRRLALSDQRAAQVVVHGRDGDLMQRPPQERLGAHVLTQVM